jgi:pimeloyl-ACP methyl ester carboxylesterase
MSREDFVQLKNGAIIAFEQYGDASGVPVIFCHGWPSSRDGAPYDEAARGLGIRIISPDRPGISGSEFAAQSQIGRLATSCRATGQSSRYREFRMLAISGGAPYAYATARAMPERVRAIAIVSGAVPIVDLVDRRGLLRLYRWMLALYRMSPQLLRKLFLMAQPILSLRPPVRFRPLVLKMLMLQTCDEESLRDSAAFEAVFESQRRAWRESAEGVMIDAQIYAQPWGFQSKKFGCRFDCAWKQDRPSRSPGGRHRQPIAQL